MVLRGMVFSKAESPGVNVVTVSVGGGGGAMVASGCSQILRSYVLGPSGFWTMAPLRYTSKFDPFLSLDCARVEGGGVIQGKEGVKFCSVT